MVANTGSMAMAFNEEGINSAGSLTKALKKPSEMSAARARAAKTILSLAKKKGEDVGITIAKVLSQSMPELCSYVQARGEAPSTDPNKLAIQAALLRSQEIGLVSKAIDTTDQDALQMLEDSEQEHVEDNTGENSSILSSDTAGALSLLVGQISKRFKRNGGSGEMKDWAAALKKYSGADGFTGVSARNLVNNAGDVDFSSIFMPTSQSDASDQAATVDANGNTISDSGGSFWNNLFDGINTVVDAVTKVSGAVQTATGAINTTVGNVSNTAGGILDQVTNIGGQIGSQSIADYMQKNWLTILGIVIALIILTVIIVRVSK